MVLLILKSINQSKTLIETLNLFYIKPGSAVHFDITQKGFFVKNNEHHDLPDSYHGNSRILRHL